MTAWRHQEVTISQELFKVKVTKAELIAENEELDREIEKLKAVLADSRRQNGECVNTIVNIRRELSMKASRAISLVKDIECYSELNAMLNSELLSVRMELQRTRYELRLLQVSPVQAKAAEPEQAQPIVKYKDLTS